MYEVIIIGSFIVLFAAAFMMAISALFYSLANFTSGEVNKLHTGSGVSNLFISFGKTFAIFFISASLFIYTMSFFLRIGNNALRRQESERIPENMTLSEETPLLAQKENPDAPLFDLLIQAAAEQNEKKQITSVAAFGGIFGLSAILTMALYMFYRTRNEKYIEGRK